MRDTDHGRTADVRRGAAVTTQALVNVFGNLNAPNAVRDHRRLLWPVAGPALQRRTGVGDGGRLKLLAQGVTGAQPTGGRCIKGRVVWVGTDVCRVSWRSLG